MNQEQAKIILKEAFGEPEHDWLDFKLTINVRDDEDKGELVKDLSALANTVDRVGYLIIGAKFIPGQPLQPAGFAGGYDDADFQRIMKGKLNRPISFEYLETDYEGKRYGIFEVPYSDCKPHQVKKGLGKIADGQVFVRRGTSTESATVEEIIEMSLNAVNDLSKIEPDDLAARVVVLLRRGDHVGISEMLRNAPRPIEQAMRNLPPDTDKMRRFMALLQQKTPQKISNQICSCCSRVSVIGFAIIRHCCLECYDDLLRCLARLYLASRPEQPFTGYPAPTQVWRSILALAAYSTSRRNWNFLETFLCHHITLASDKRIPMFIHPLRTDTKEYADAFGRFSTDDRFLEEMAHESDSLNRSLLEFDFLAHLFTRQRMSQVEYDANWHQYDDAWIRPFLDEIRYSKEVADLLNLPSKFELPSLLQDHFKRFKKA